MVPVIGAHITNTSTKSPSGILSGDLSQGHIPVFGARKLKTQKTTDNLKSGLSRNLQVTLCGIQASLISVETVSTVSVSTTTTVLASGFAAITQSTGTTTLIYPHFYLPDTLDIRLSQRGNTTCNALIATEATISCMSESCYQKLMLPHLKHSCNITVRSASGANLYPMSLVTCTFCLGKQTFTYNFTVWKNLARPFIYLGFLCEHKIEVQWSDTGERILTLGKHICMGSIETTPSGHKISPTSQVSLLAKALTNLNTRLTKLK